jgi:MFS family permease
MPPTTLAPEVESARGWQVVWACFAALALIFGVSYAFAALFDPWQREFGATRAQVSLVFGVSGLLYFVLGAGAGLLADRFGPRVVASAGMVCIACGLLASSLADQLARVVWAYGLGIGVGIALVYTPAIACVQPWFTRRRGLAAGIASAGIGAGTLAGPLATQALVAAVGWRGALQVLAATLLLAGLAATTLLRRAPAASATRGAPVPGATLRQALASPSFRWLYAMCLLAGTPMFVPFAHVSAAARDLGSPEADAVALVGLIGIGSLVGRFAIGALADRIGRERTMVLLQVSLGASFGVWAAAGGWTAMAVFALWMGLSYGGQVSLMPALVMDHHGARAVSSILGVLYTGAAFGNLAGPWLAGALFDRTGSYQATVWACIALSTLATGCAWRAAQGRGGGRTRE